MYRRIKPIEEVNFPQLRLYLRSKLKAMGVSSRQFAKEIGLAESVLSKYKKGVHYPRPPALYKIALGISHRTGEDPSQVLMDLVLSYPKIEGE